MLGRGLVQVVALTACALAGTDLRLPAAEPAGDYALTVTADGGAPGGPPSSDDRTVRIG